jgi:hypothetical protein
MKEVVLIDYAMPLMRVERLAKEIHDLCLEDKYEGARETAMQLVVESRLLQTTLRYMSEEKEKRYAVPNDDQSRTDAVQRPASKKFATNGVRPHQLRK